MSVDDGMLMMPWKETDCLARFLVLEQKIKNLFGGR